MTLSCATWAQAQAEQRLAAAIAEIYSALTAVQDAHARAYRRGFADRLGEFLKPPPSSPISDFALREYLKFAELRRQPTAAPAPMVEVAVEAPFFTPPAERFVPKRVPHQLVEEISPIAPMRRVRLLHTVRASNLAIGHARLRAGEEMAFPAKAAFVLTYSGVGVYTDGETAEATTAA